MGMDLRLYIASRHYLPDQHGPLVSDTVLDVPRNSELFAEILALPRLDRMDQQLLFLVTGNVFEKDGYGERLYAVTAGDLVTLQESSENRFGVFSPRTRAVFAYVRELPAPTKVVLYWH